MKLLTMAALALVATTTFASLPIAATLDDLARGADHILVGRVVGVDMIDESCRPLTGPQARTGPGLKNIIRLHIVVDEVQFTTAKSVSQVLKVPLDPFMHYSLDQIKEVYAHPSEPRLILLRGPHFQPVIPGAFMRSIGEKEEALRINRESRHARRSLHESRTTDQVPSEKQAACD